MSYPKGTNVLDRPINSNPTIITADEAGNLVGLSGRTIRRLCNDGTIPNCVQLGRSWRIRKDSLLALFGIEG